MDLRKVKKLIELVEESGIQELEVASGDESIRISMPVGATAAVVAAPSTATVAETVASPSVTSQQASAVGSVIHAPMAGTFYRAPHPDAAAFVEVGQRVNAGDVVCIIESMKMMHEIRAETSGTVSQVNVDNGQPISTGDALFSLS